ncbi:MAG: hypothetical protein IV097_17650 [Burkholderiaceae bacterium]|nr:hypothetical protein [Burkholderiaceae bacterium]
MLMQGLFAGTAALLGLLGMTPASAQDIIASSGPFSLQRVEKKSGLQFNANYGFIRVHYYEIRVLYRGKPLKLPDAAGRAQTDFRDAFVLVDAPEPALLVSSAGWQLVTERDGRAVVSALTGGAADELRWADGPAAERRIDVGRTRTEVPAALELKGRRRLLLDDKTVLDINTLQLSHPGRRQADAPGSHDASRPQPAAAEPSPADRIPAGYVLAIRDPLGTSPDGRALAQLYRGASNSPRDALIVVGSLDGSGQTQLLPVDLQALTGDKEFPTTVAPLLRHFEWVQRGQELPHLRPLPAADSTRQGWRAQFQFGLAAPLSPQGQRLPRYSVAPVRPAMFAAVRGHLIAHCQAMPAPAQPGDAPAERFARLNLWIIPLVLRFDADERSLVVESAPTSDQLWAQTAVSCAGEAIDAQLREGGPWRQYLALQR